jgi:hypothetical protein
MGKRTQMPTPPLSSGSLANSPNNPVPATAICEQLARVVNSPGFTSSARLCRFLTHIVDRTIDGKIDSLEELSIAMDVFDRTSEYDPNIDAIVRVEARRLMQTRKGFQYRHISSHHAALGVQLQSALKNRVRPSRPTFRPTCHRRFDGW